MKRYVGGFMFAEKENSVVLIRKLRPQWQAGFWNWVGGHIEEGEFAVQAMVREFREETGVATTPDMWEHFCTLRGCTNTTHTAKDSDAWEVMGFRAVSNLAGTVKSTTDEHVHMVSLDELPSLDGHGIINNLHWLLPMAQREIAGQGMPYLIYEDTP